MAATQNRITRRKWRTSADAPRKVATAESALTRMRREQAVLVRRLRPNAMPLPGEWEAPTYNPGWTPTQQADVEAGLKQAGMAHLL